MDWIFFALIALGVGHKLYQLKLAAQIYGAPMLPFAECQACERELFDHVPFKLLEDGKSFVCGDCAPVIEEEIKAIVPFWFNQPLVGEKRDEPAQEPPQLAEVEDDEPPVKEIEAVPLREKPLPRYCVPMFETLSDEEALSFIMRGESGRGKSFDIQMMAQFAKAEKEKRA